MSSIVLLTFLINVVIILARVEVGPDPDPRVEEHTYLDVYSSAISRAHYNPWVCNYFREPGYKCLSCASALHCFPGNFALLVQCAGRFPYCRNGYCSRYKQEGCSTEEVDIMDVEQQGAPESTMPPYVAGSANLNKNKTQNIPANQIETEQQTLADIFDPNPEDIAPNKVKT